MNSILVEAFLENISYYIVVNYIVVNYLTLITNIYSKLMFINEEGKIIYIIIYINIQLFYQLINAKLLIKLY